MLNQIILVGRLTKDPEFHQYGFKDGGFYSFSLAFNQDKEKDTCEFIDCSCGEHLNKAMEVLHKGDKIALVGRFSNRKFQRRDGSNGVSAIIYVDNVEFVDVLKDEEAQKPVEEKPTPKTETKTTRRR